MKAKETPLNVFSNELIDHLGLEDATEVLEECEMEATTTRKEIRSYKGMPLTLRDIKRDVLGNSTVFTIPKYLVEFTYIEIGDEIHPSPRNEVNFHQLSARAKKDVKVLKPGDILDGIENHFPLRETKND